MQVIALFLRSKLKEVDANNKISGEIVSEEHNGQSHYTVLETLRLISEPLFDTPLILGETF